MAMTVEGFKHSQFQGSLESGPSIHIQEVYDGQRCGHEFHNGVTLERAKYCIVFTIFVIDE
uniref:Uncharacterized protein n=1 Tax=Oryza nivara TaxID=4536 RepID=A0A0E0HHF1_ORYNI